MRLDMPLCSSSRVIAKDDFIIDQSDQSDQSLLTNIEIGKAEQVSYLYFISIGERKNESPKN